MFFTVESPRAVDNPYDGTWRDLEVGVDPEWEMPEEADGANDGPGIPLEPVYTRLESGTTGLPWWDAVEDPETRIELPQSMTPNAWSPAEDVGSVQRQAAYEGAYRTRGPVRAFGLEPSGGFGGDQAVGRIMRFPANAPDRFDLYGVFNTDPRDELAGAMSVADLPYDTTTTITTDLLQYPNVWNRW